MNSTIRNQIINDVRANKSIEEVCSKYGVSKNYIEGLFPRKTPIVTTNYVSHKISSPTEKKAIQMEAGKKAANTKRKNKEFVNVSSIIIREHMSIIANSLAIIDTELKKLE